MDERHNKEIDRLYLQMYPKLFEYARSSLKNDSLAEEAVQDTFIIACQKPDALFRCTSPEGWLVKTLKNVISNTLRSQDSARRIIGEYLTTTARDISVTDNQIELELLYDDVATLEEFILLKEMAIDGRSYLEMSQKRCISMATCRKRVQRAKEFLRKKLKI